MPRIFWVFFLFFAVFPFFTGIFYFDEMSAAYRLMWQNFLGAHYKLAPETPKPLIMLLTGVLPQWFNFFLAPFLMAVTASSIFKIARYLGMSLLAAGCAVFFCLFCNSQVLPYFFLSGFSFWPLAYLALVFLQMLLFLKKRYTSSFVLSFFAALVRPESWLIAVILPVYFIFKKEKLRPVYFLPFVAPFLWALIDWRISGDFFISQKITTSYPFISAMDAVGFSAYWPKVLGEIFQEYSAILIIFGLLAFTMNKIKSKQFKDCDILFVCAAAIFLFYWVAALGKSVVLMTRFFAWPVLMITLYASSLIENSFRRNRIFMWVNIIYLAATAFFVFNDQIWEFTALRARVYSLQKSALKETEDFISAHYDKVEQASYVLVPARKAADFAFTLGEKNSHKMIYLREALTRKIDIDKSIAIYVNLATRGFDILETPAVHAVNLFGTNYIFRPVYVSNNGMAVVYQVMREAL